MWGYVLIHVALHFWGALGAVILGHCIYILVGGYGVACSPE